MKRIYLILAVFLMLAAVIAASFLFMKASEAFPGSAQAQFQVSYVAGTYDSNGKFMGGTELMNLVAHQGKLYAGVSYWKDVPGTDPSPGAQVLVRDMPSTAWRVDHSFPGTLRLLALQSFTFMTDGDGRQIAPVSILLATPNDVVAGTVSVWSRDDTSGEWTEMVLARPGTRSTIRSLGFHHDPVTGADYVFAGANTRTSSVNRVPVNIQGNVGIFRGVYDPTVPGRIRWSEIPEFTDYIDRPMAFAEANGVLHVSAKGFLYRRVDGPVPSWVKVFSVPNAEALGPTNSGLRGLTAIPNPSGQGQVLLAALEGSASAIYRIDPATNYQAVVELDIVAFLHNQWNTQKGMYVIPAYNNMLTVTDPRTNQPVHLIGLQAHNRQAGKSRSAWYLIRHPDATYELHEIVSVFVPQRSDQALDAVRAIQVSPFPPDAGHVLYFGGYDASNEPSHNTAWLYQADIQTVFDITRTTVWLPYIASSSHHHYCNKVGCD